MGVATLFCEAQHYVCVLWSCPLIACWLAVPLTRVDRAFDCAGMLVGHANNNVKNTWTPTSPPPLQTGWKARISPLWMLFWNHLLPSHSLNVSTHVLPHNKKKGEQCEIPLFGHCFEIIFYQTTCSKSPYWSVFQGVWILSWSNLLSPKSITQVFLTNTLCSIAGPNLREKIELDK